MPPRRATRALAVALTALIGASVAGLSTAPPSFAATTPPPALGQHVAVPAYIQPNTADSTRLSTTSSPNLGFTVANVASGPDTAVKSEWKTVIDASAAHGQRVLGYVDSGYFGYTSPARTTISGERDANAWLVQAEQQVNTWYQLYGASIGGIFFDDGEDVCGPNGTSQYVDLYRQLNDYVHTYHPGALTVVNPGVPVPACYDDAADVLVTFEGSYTDLMTRPAKLVTPQWQLNADPNKFWSIVYGVPDQAALTAATAQTKRDNAGYVYFTDDLMPNPYDTLPADPYWTSELSGVAVTDSQTPVVPPRPYTTNVHSTDVDVAWTSASPSRAVGYDVLVNGTWVGSTGNYSPSDSDFHLVGLTPGTSYSVAVRSRDLAGRRSAAGLALAVTTQPSFGAPPTAPGSLTATDLTANAVRLSWTASTDSDGYVAQYEVYQDGVRQVTVDPSTRSVHLEFLKAGTPYSFRVLARDQTGTASPVSNTVSVTTPNPVPITSTSGTYTSTTLTLKAQFNVSFQFHHAFISDGANASTGYPINGIVADFLFEEGTFYRHDPNAPGAYSWIALPEPANQPFLASTTGGLWVWQAPASYLTAGASSLQVVFDASGGGSPQVTLAPLSVAKQ